MQKYKKIGLEEEYSAKKLLFRDNLSNYSQQDLNRDQIINLETVIKRLCIRKKRVN
jgi:hypothetical protein